MVEYAGHLDTDAFDVDERLAVDVNGDPIVDENGDPLTVEDLDELNDEGFDRLAVDGIESDENELRSDLDEAERRLERQSVAMIDALGDTIDPLTIVLLALIPAAAVLQSWWLARAYRCLPGRHRRTDPRTAYRPVSVLVFATALSRASTPSASAPGRTSRGPSCSCRSSPAC